MKKSTAAGLAFATAALVAATRTGKPPLAKKALRESRPIVRLVRYFHSDTDRIVEQTAERYMMYVNRIAPTMLGYEDAAEALRNPLLFAVL